MREMNSEMTVLDVDGRLHVALQFVFSILRFLWHGAVPWHPKTSMQNMGNPRHSESLEELLDSIVSIFELLFQFKIFFQTSTIERKSTSTNR